MVRNKTFFARETIIGQFEQFVWFKDAECPVGKKPSLQILFEHFDRTKFILLENVTF